MIDIANARALVETLKDYAEHPSSFTDISPTEADAAADLIAALLDEVERLNSPVVLSEWQKLATERDALIAEVRDREDVLERAGFRRCDISACNCGSWHQVGGFKARFDEIKEAIAEHVDLNGKTLLTAVQEALAERNALARDAARYREFVVSGGWHRHIDGEHPEESYSYLVVGLPVDADLSCYAARKLAMDKVLDEGSER